MSEDFREELTRNLSNIRSQVRRVARDRDEVDELTQECVARLLQKERLWQQRGPLAHWIAAVVRRFSISWARKRSRRDQKRVEVGSMDTFAQPEEDKYSEDDIRHILEQFRHLTDAQREVLQLKYLEGLSTQEVASQLGITSSAVSQRSSKALQTLRERARAGWAQWLWPWVWLQKGITMMGKNKLASAVVLALTVFGLSQLGLSDEPYLGKILDSQGLSQLRPATADRWQAARKDGELLIGDWLKTSPRGANLLQVRLKDGSLCLLGPGTLVEVEAESRIKLLRGFVDLEPAEGSQLTVVGPKGTELQISQPTMLQVGAAGLTPLETAPPWLAAYKQDQPEPLGSLLANIDGRDVALSVQDHRVFVDIRDQIARTRIVQTFVNHTDDILEGVFSFPLPEGASVSGFAMWIGGEKVEGDIVEKQRARAIYEQILREERDPGLLEWEGGNLFQASVYPIAHTKRIEISYTQVLPRKGKGYRYRYALMSELLRERPLKELEIEVSLSSSVALSSVSCPSHPVRLRQQSNTATLHYDAEEVTPTADFELLVVPEPSPVPMRFIPHKRSDEGYFLLAIDGPERPGELRALPDAEPLKLLLLADTSASMDPQKRALQAACIEALLGALSKRDRFQLHAFDIESVAAFDAPLPVTDKNIDAALEFLGRRASLGWTDLDAAFEAAARAAAPGTQLVYLGDAIPTTGDAEPAAHSQRIRSLLADRGLVSHAIGLGSSYEGQVLRAIGASGSNRVVRDRSSALLAADALLEEILYPSLRNIELQIEGIETAAVYPERLTSLPAGQQLFVVGRYLPGTGPADVKITLRGELGGQTVEHSLQTSSDEAGRENSFIPRLWARSHLEHLLEQIPSALIQGRIVGLSEDFQIMTPYTSLLVLESDADRERFAVERRFKMRDGEEFFQAGHDLAQLELQREQLRMARGWRVQLQRRYLQHFAQMGRREVAVVVTTGEVYKGQDEQRRTRGLNRDGWGPGAPSGGAEYFFGEAASKELEELDWTATAQPLAPAESPIVMDPMSGDKNMDFDLADDRLARNSPAPARQNSTFELEASLAMDDGLFRVAGLREELRSSLQAGGFAGRYDDSRSFYAPQGPQLVGLFPRVGEPRAEAPPARWPEAVRAAVLGLDRRAVLASEGLRLECSAQHSGNDKLERVIPQAAQIWLLSPESWLEVASGPRQATSLQWTDGALRSSLNATYGLGRERSAEDGDLDAWTGPIPYLFETLETSFASLEPELDELGDTLRISLRSPQSPDYLVEVRVDPVRQVVLEVLSSHKGTVSQRVIFGDFVELAGYWWPQSRELRDAEGKLSQATRYQLQTHTAETFSARLATLLEPASDAIMLPDTLPERAEAKSQAAQGTADGAALLVLTDLELYFGRWETARARFDELAALQKDKPGLRRLRRELLLHGRRQAEALELLQAWAAELAAGKGREPLFVALELLGQAYSFHANEQRVLLETLEPVFAAADPLLDAQADYGQRLFQLYQQLGWPSRAFELSQQLQADWPHHHSIQSTCIQLKFQRLDVEGAFTQVELAVERGIWTDNERVALRQQGANLRLQSRRLNEFLSYSEQHGETLRFGSSHWENVLAALIMLDRTEEADARIREWLQLDPTDSAALPRVQGAISHALGQYWNLFYYNQKDPRFHPELEAFVARHRDTSEAWSQIGRILREGWFVQSETGVRLLASVRKRVETELESMEPRALYQRLSWLAGNVDNDAWQALVDRLLERWKTGRDPQLLSALMSWAGAERLVEIRKLELTTAREDPELQVPAAASNLLSALHSASWSAEREDLAMQTLSEAWDPETAEPALTADSWLRSLVDWAIAGRRADAEQADPDANQRSRRDLASQRETWLEDARRAVSQRLAGMAETFPVEALRPYIQAEALYWQAQLKEPAAPIQAGYWELFASVPDSTGLAGQFLATRSLESLAHLAVTALDDAAAADSLLAVCDARLASGSELYDWQSLKIGLLLCLDRADATRETLEAWLADSDRFLVRSWRILLGVLYAETGDLESAVARFEELQADDELGAADLKLLSTWYLLLERDADAAAAQVASYGFQPEWELQNRLWQAVQQADGIQARVDEEAPLMLRALLRQASWPGNHCWVIQNFYSTTKDFRLLACLSEGVIGHTPQGIYNYLQQVGQILSLVHEEATADLLAVAIDEARAAAQTPVDRRALAFLDFLASQAAAGQLQGAEAWQRRALASFEAALAEPAEAEEIRLLAEFLCNLGALPRPLDEAQRAAVAKLYAAQPRQSDNYLPLAELWARLLWTYNRRVEAHAVLKNAIDASRQPPHSTLPASADNALRTLSSYTKQLGEYSEAERMWSAELARPYSEQRRREFQREFYNVHIEAYPGYTTSFGKGAQLYRKTFESLLAELEKRSDENHAANLVQQLLWLVDRADDHRERTAERDLEDFAFNRLPPILALYQYRNGQNMVQNVASTLREVSSARTALRFLIVRAENEPRWLGYANQDYWSYHSYTLGDLRKRVSKLGDLEDRLLALVLPALQQDLERRNMRNWNMLYIGNSDFWNAKRKDFGDVAQAVVEERGHVLSVLMFAAEYLYSGLHYFNPAIDALKSGRARGLEAVQLRSTLVRWLQEQKRWQESLALAEQLVVEVPHELVYRQQLVRALYYTGKREEAAAALAAAEAHWREAKLWNENVVAGMANVCLECNFLDEAAVLFAEAINLRKRYVTLNDWTLSHYYNQQADTLAKLGRLDEAVDAAAGAILAWSDSRDERRDALERLVAVLLGAKDLDGWVREFEAELATSKTESALLRRAVGEAWFRRKAWRKAAHHWQAALAVQPHDQATREKLLQAYDKLGDTKAAVASLMAGIAASPFELASYAELGRRLQKAEQTQDAERAFTSLAELKPHQSEGHAQLAEHFMAQKRPAEAAVQWRQVVRIRSDEPPGYLGLAKSLRAAGQLEEAREVLRKLLGQEWDERFGDVHGEALRILSGM